MVRPSVVGLAGFDRRHDGGRIGPTQPLQIHRASHHQIIDAALEIAGGDVGLQVSARTSGGGVILMAGQRVGRGAEGLCRPAERDRGSV